MILQNLLCANALALIKFSIINEMHLTVNSPIIIFLSVSLSIVEDFILFLLILTLYLALKKRDSLNFGAVTFDSLLNKPINTSQEYP